MECSFTLAQHNREFEKNILHIFPKTEKGGFRVLPTIRHHCRRSPQHGPVLGFIPSSSDWFPPIQFLTILSPVQHWSCILFSLRTPTQASSGGQICLGQLPWWPLPGEGVTWSQNDMQEGDNMFGKKTKLFSRDLVRFNSTRVPEAHGVAQFVMLGGVYTRSSPELPLRIFVKVL